MGSRTAMRFRGSTIRKCFMFYNLTTLEEDANVFKDKKGGD